MAWATPEMLSQLLAVRWGCRVLPEMEAFMFMHPFPFPCLKLKLREVMGCTWHHVPSQWQSQNLNPGLQAPRSRLSWVDSCRWSSRAQRLGAGWASGPLLSGAAPAQASLRLTEHQPG